VYARFQNENDRESGTGSRECQGLMALSWERSSELQPRSPSTWLCFSRLGEGLGYHAAIVADAAKRGFTLRIFDLPYLQKKSRKSVGRDGGFFVTWSPRSVILPVASNGVCVSGSSASVTACLGRANRTISMREVDLLSHLPVRAISLLILLLPSHLPHELTLTESHL
jgi:hypothetical protein